MPPKPGHIDHAGDRLERSLEHPVLNRLELVQGVARALEDVADDLAGRAPGREPRIHARREIVERVDPVDDLLARLPVVGRIGELALDVRQAGDRRAAQVFQPGHAVQGDLDGNADQSFHFLGAGAGVLGDHLDQRRSRVGIGLDVKFFAE